MTMFANETTDAMRKTTGVDEHDEQLAVRAPSISTRRAASIPLYSPIR
jgi:hypothetical protein